VVLVFLGCFGAFLMGLCCCGFLERYFSYFKSELSAEGFDCIILYICVECI
jgi:hypothetical protein